MEYYCVIPVYEYIVVSLILILEDGNILALVEAPAGYVSAGTPPFFKT